MITFKFSNLESGKLMYGEPPYIIKCINNSPVEVVNEYNQEYLNWLQEGNEITEWIEEDGN